MFTDLISVLFRGNDRNNALLLKLFNPVTRANAIKSPITGMSLDDWDRVVQARNLLVRDLSSPLCTKQLSRTTSLNMNKLQQGFRRLYGVLVFQDQRGQPSFLRNRLERQPDCLCCRLYKCQPLQPPGL